MRNKRIYIFERKSRAKIFLINRSKQLAKSCRPSIWNVLLINWFFCKFLLENLSLFQILSNFYSWTQMWISQIEGYSLHFTLRSSTFYLLYVRTFIISWKNIAITELSLCQVLWHSYLWICGISPSRELSIVVTKLWIFWSAATSIMS